MTPSASANRQIARAAGIVMASFVLANLTGLLRQILVTRAFGTGAEIDAFSAASTYPDILFNLIAGGALASAFIPTLTGFLKDGDRAGAWTLASAIGNLVFVILGAVSVVSAVFAPWIVAHILAPGFPAAEQALTADLLRIRLIAPAIFGVSGLMMGLLNTHQVFLWPALAPTFYWLGIIAGALAAPWLGIYGLAWGAVLGAVMHLTIQIPAFMRLPGRFYAPTFGLRFPAVREVARLMGPRLLGVGVVQLNFLVNTILASGMGAGPLGALGYAWAIMTMPQVVIAQAIAIAALPTFAAQAARGAAGEMRASLAAVIRGVLLLSIPATLGLILLRRPLIVVLFQRGQFDARSTEMVAWALLWYTSGLVFHSVLEVTSRAFYALHDTKTPVLVGVGAMTLNLVFSLLFVAGFGRIGWMAHGGLALANSTATTLESLVLLWLMRRRLSGLDERRVMVGLGQALAGAALMGAALWGWLALAAGGSAWVAAAGGIAIGAGVYAGAMLGMRNEETIEGMRLGMRRLKIR
jgi:putative peptidoglycan lipid II flippase